MKYKKHAFLIINKYAYIYIVHYIYTRIGINMFAHTSKLEIHAYAYIFMNNYDLRLILMHFILKMNII